MSSQFLHVSLQVSVETFNEIEPAYCSRARMLGGERGFDYISITGRTSVVVEGNFDKNAARRRRALELFLTDNGLQPAEWAKRAGLRNANSIYNFLRGESASLNYATYEKLASVIPGTTIAQLTGEASVSPTPGVPSITVDINAAANRLTEQAALPAAEQYQMGVTAKHRALPGAHGIEILDDSADEIYPLGTILVCVPFKTFMPAQNLGRRVILRRRHKSGGFDITVREVRNDEKDQLWLWMRSTNPRLQGAVAIPRRYDGGRFKLGDGTTGEITDVIIASYRSEI